MSKYAKWLRATAEQPIYMPAAVRQRYSEAATEIEANDLNAFQKKQGRWAANTFGDQTTEEKLRHLIKEIREIMDDPQDVVEYADALSLLLDAARLQGISASEIVRAARKKLDVNKRRTWTKNPDGTYSGSKLHEDTQKAVGDE